MFIIFMGVAGCGKTTLGKITAEALGVHFYEGDDFHPPENVEKMANGIPLNDDDRAGWLAALATIIREGLAQGESGVMSCSALKEKYREQLRVDADRVKFIYLKGSYDLIRGRMAAREGHYMPPELLQSQFDTLEEPEGVLTVDIAQPPETMLGEVLVYLHEIGFVGGSAA
ncbi:gluconokinase [bacterium]|nr:gluconokinase [bacterium]